MASKRLFILLTLLLLLICVLMENGEAFDRPQKGRRRRFRRVRRCSRRKNNCGTKVDDIKPLDMNHVSTILVCDQFYNIQYLLKSLSVREHIVSIAAVLCLVTQRFLVRVKGGIYLAVVQRQDFSLFYIQRHSLRRCATARFRSVIYNSFTLIYIL